MDKKEDEDYYLKLSRRELQELCKKNGLPSNRIKCELAKLLASCSQVSVSAMGVVHNDLANNGKAEAYGCSNVESRETVGCSPLGSQCDYVGLKVKSKETSRFIEVRDCDQNLMGSTRRNGSGNISKDVPTESNFVSSDRVDMKSVPSFEFHVRSEEGIDLFVDLNTGPSEWIQNLNNGVCIHPKVSKNKLWAIHDDHRNFRGGEEEAKASDLTNKEGDILSKGDPMFTSSSLSSIGQHSEVDKSSGSFAVMCNDTPVDVVGGIVDHNHMETTVCGPNFDRHSQLDMCTKLSPQKSKKIILGSEVLVPPLGCFTKAAGLMEMRLSGGASHSENMPHLPNQNGGAPDLDIAVAANDVQNDIGTSTNCDLDLNQCLDPISERLQGRNNITKDTVSPKCSQLDMLPRDCKRGHSSDSDGLQTKRQFRPDDDCKFPSILRNSKDLATDAYPRRSMRLVSK